MNKNIILGIPRPSVNHERAVTLGLTETAVLQIVNVEVADTDVVRLIEIVPARLITVVDRSATMIHTASVDTGSSFATPDLIPFWSFEGATDTIGAGDFVGSTVQPIFQDALWTRVTTAPFVIDGTHVAQHHVDGVGESGQLGMYNVGGPGSTSHADVNIAYIQYYYGIDILAGAGLGSAPWKHNRWTDGFASINRLLNAAFVNGDFIYTFPPLGNTPNFHMNLNLPAPKHIDFDGNAMLIKHFVDVSDVAAGGGPPWSGDIILKTWIGGTQHMERTVTFVGVSGPARMLWNNYQFLGTVNSGGVTGPGSGIDQYLDLVAASEQDMAALP